MLDTHGGAQYSPDEPRTDEALSVCDFDERITTLTRELVDTVRKKLAPERKSWVSLHHLDLACCKDMLHRTAPARPGALGSTWALELGARLKWPLKSRCHGLMPLGLTQGHFHNGSRLIKWMLSSCYCA